MQQSSMGLLCPLACLYIGVAFKNQTNKLIEMDV